MACHHIKQGDYNMRHVHLAVILLIAIAIIPGIALSQGFANFKPGSEPDGFRGIKWGTDISTLTNMDLFKTDPDDVNLKIYKRKGDSFEIGAAKVKSISYGFWNGKLSTVNILVDGEMDFNHLKNACFEKFGDGHKANQFMENYIWAGNKTRMGLKYETVARKGSLFICSTDMVKKMQLQDQYKAREGAKKGF